VGTGLGVIRTLYFCTPHNDKMLGYWDTVADRLFKVRHCMNIEGIERALPLFESPIDPTLLVQAVARGQDLGSVLDDISAPVPYYRFSYLLARALELCADLKSLGAALLSALEKQDAETLAALRSSHETALLDRQREVRKQQLFEAQVARETLDKTRDVTNTRYEFYSNIIDRLSQESNQLTELTTAMKLQGTSQGYESVASDIATYTPDLSVGVAGQGPYLAATLGRENIIAYYQALSRQSGYDASVHTYSANRMSILGNWARRANDWTLQQQLASKELIQVDKQIAGAEIRIAIAERELLNHERQIEQSKSVEEFLRTKYTNKDLYGWMISQVLAVYSECYKMAYDMAKRAERAYRFERGMATSDFIRFGSWDTAKKGLLSGERLYLALKQMERAYLEQNKREYEITKHISLVLNDPMALIALKETGRCEVFLPEALFDADYPGHYMRRIKSVSVTMPCVVGPYTSINCTLTLLSNKTRIKNEVGGKYEEDLENEDPRFVANFAAMQSIATSSAQNDSGMFELNFRDERYLPFEGAGVISRWRIDMPKDFNAFDFNTLSDVVLHLKYTAREGGEMLGGAAKKAMQEAIENEENIPLVRLFSAKHEFPTAWYSFLHPADITATNQTLQLDLTQERFPFLLRGKTITLRQLKMFLKLKDEFASNNPLPLKINLGEKRLDNIASSVQPLGDLAFDSQGSPINRLPFCKLENISIKIPKELVLAATKSDLADMLKQDAIEDIWIVCEYSITSNNP
jgi:hypothetical protein